MIKVRVVKFHKVSTLICASIALALPLSAAQAQPSYPGAVQSACSDLGTSISAPACTYCHTDGGFNANALSKSDAMALLCPNLPVSQTDTGTTTTGGTGTTTTNTDTTTSGTGSTTVSDTSMTDVSGSDEAGETESPETSVRKDVEKRTTFGSHFPAQAGDHDGLATADQPPMNAAAVSHSKRLEHRSVNLAEQQVHYSNHTSSDRTTGSRRHSRHHEDD